MILFIEAFDNSGKYHNAGNAPPEVLVFEYIKYAQELILLLYRLDNIPAGIVSGPDIRNILLTLAN